MYDLRIINGLCYIDDSFIKTNIYTQSGKIASITEAILPALVTVDACGQQVLPGFIDPHVHLKLNIGEFTSADDFISGSELAALGGVTTLIDFLDPIYHNEQLINAYQERQNDAQHISVDYAFHCTLGNFSDDVKQLEKALEALGISSIKVFTTYSESNRQCPYEVIKQLFSTDLLVLAHAEDDDMIYSPNTILDYESSRSELSELSAVKKLLSLLKETTGKLYIVHVSSGNTLDFIEKAVFEDRLFLESCPQYFYLNKSLFTQEDGQLYLLAPPLRSEKSVELLRDHVHKLNGIATDHCPFKTEEKLKYKKMDAIPKGIGTLGLSFQLMYALFGPSIIPKFTSEPAKIFGLKSKGSIDISKDADFAIIDLKEVTHPREYLKQCDYSAYKESLPLKVVKTILRGEIIMSDGIVKKAMGQYVRR